MLQEILTYISTLDTGYVYLILFFFAFIENVFPPSPSDVVVIIGATLISSTSAGFIPILLITSIGSALGFILMYLVGNFFGDNILRSGKLKFISPESLVSTSKWFNKYGYYLILVNRFLPGTRSVISFFTGIHKLKVGKTFLFALISAFAWNVVIIFMGMELGKNVALIDKYLSTYSTIIILLTAVVIFIFVVRYFLKKRKI